MPIINDKLDSTNKFLDSFGRERFHDKSLEEKIPIDNTAYDTATDRTYKTLGAESIYLRPKNTHSSEPLAYSILTSDKYESEDISDYVVHQDHNEVTLNPGDEAVSFDEFLVTSKTAMVMLRFKSANPSEIGGIARVI